MSFAGVHLWANIGCGDQHAGEPWTDCDIQGHCHPEVRMDATAIWPFPAGTLERVYLGQVLEHLAYPAGVAACLGHAWEAMRSGGVLAVVCPDGDALDAHLVAPDVREMVVHGQCRWPGDEHRWLPTRRLLLEQVRSVFTGAHLVHPSLLGEGWPPGGRDIWDCAILATRGAPAGVDFAAAGADNGGGD